MERRGFLNAVLKRGELEEQQVNRMLGQLTGHSKTALAAQKRLSEAWQNAGLCESVRASVDEFARVFEE